MDNRLVYSPLSMLLMLVFGFLLLAVIGLLFLDLARTAFIRIGFSWGQALFVLLASLLGSNINIPVKNLQCTVPIVQDRYVRAFGIAYRIPVLRNVSCSTLLAVNVGGAVIPTIISLALIYRFPVSLPYVLAAVAFVALITHMVARPVRGLGIVTPALLPPVSAAIAALILVYIFSAPHDVIFLLAYAGGTLGTLIGADILNLNRIKNLGAPVASIGGAGTFDGVFLSGLIAVLLL
ncbi:MAG TPA: DUF1614 domain-containing protein [Methanothrix sp.]|nr:DUF1614 domain-containing protein [Methanothrix sp.]HOV82519.1 DUF1614 domain-containing protein [Methanothrix sp.]HPC89799.1 DUF1614 domain-containing protein [Methanothrix sp.]HQE87558.1 DUF1614 domain-containing protein [Methanothrix sp.]HQI68131.1 DUF1614 domain-containing protein [Methanothrix sp.]